MKISNRAMALISFLAALPFAAQTLAETSPVDPAKVVIIKADDFKGPNQAWTDFLQASRDMGIKVGLGVIVEYIDGNTSTYQWMRDQDALGDVEFWNHGWDHKRTKDADGNTLYSEFDGSGLAHMHDHMQLAQAGMKTALGRDAVSFGTPYNGFDADTATVINETLALRLLFSRDGSAETLLDDRVSVVGIISELDGTGKPNAAKFINTFPSGPAGPVSLQFHPTAFNTTGIGEYTNIVQYLQSKGYTIMLPTEYAAAVDPPVNTVVSSTVAFEPLFHVDFESDTAGTVPASADLATEAGNGSITVSNSTPAGTGNGVVLTDIGNPDYIRMGYDFTSEAGESAVRIDMDIARLTEGTTGHNFQIGLFSKGKDSGSYRDRYATVLVYDNGDISYQGGSTVRTDTGALALNTPYTLTLYANDGDTEITNYEGTRDLAPDSVDFWLNGVYQATDSLRTRLDATPVLDPANTTDALGRIGIVSISSQTPGVIAVDNLNVSAIKIVELRDLLTESFEDYTAGDVPAADRAYAAGDAENFISVVGEAVNTAGTGNGVQIKDNSADGTGLEYEFGPNSAVKVSFDFSPLELVAEANASFAFGVGQAGAALTSHTRRYAQFSMFNDGSMRGYFAGSSVDPDPITAGSSNNLTMYANDYDSKIVSYTEGGTTYILPPNSLAWWVNGVLQRNGPLEYGSLDVNEETAGGTVGTSEDNLARFGINTLSSQVNLNFVFDNFSVSELVVPPDWARAHNLFMDHMVLQRDLDVPVWGTGSPGAAVDVLLDNVLAGSATVDAQGDWMVRLAPHAQDGGVPHQLKVQVADEVQQVISDVIFGDVYLCSGQSNMEFVMSSMPDFVAGYSTEDNSNIRHIAIQRGYSESPRDEPVIERVWETTAPGTIANFTAVGYLFAKEIYARTGVPIGLLNSSYGGQRIHRYVSFQGLEEVPELAGYLTAAEEGAESSVATIYNAQIAPLLPFGICGILWYQGETDRSGPILYEEKMRALIRGWRSAWAGGDLPFYYVQLPHFNTTGYIFIRDAQLRALSEPDCGMAVTIDVGDDTNIHPTNKQDPGFRLAQWALAKQYGFANVYSGPIVADTVQEGPQIRVLFDYAEDGLMIGRKEGTNAVEEVSGGPLECFEVAGSDRVFVAADAVIDADTVLVSAPSVSSPQYVRYCYSDTSNGNNRLYNAAGLPAAAFRTDASHQLLVKNGTGSANPVLSGTVIPVAAGAAPSGSVFDRWVGGGNAIADAGSASTTVTMPDRDLYLYATYRDSAVSTHTLTVNNGAGGGTTQAGTMMEISAQAAPAGQAFEGWIGDTQTVVNVSSAVTTLQMPASKITVTATYREKATPPVPMLEINSIDVSGNQLSMWLMATEAGARYELEHRTNLVEGIWETVVYNIKSDGQDTQMAFSTAGREKAFYRLKRR